MAMSIGERKIKMLLESGDIDFIQEFSFPDLKSDRGVALRFDFAVFHDPECEDIAFLIEYNGEQHYEQKMQTRSAFYRQQSNDKRKRNYCEVKGISLVTIPWTEYNAMTLDSILNAGKFFD